MGGEARYERRIEAVAGETAVDCLARGSELSKRELKLVMRKGAVWLTRGGGARRLRRAKSVLRAGDRLDLYYDPAVLSAEPPAARVLHDLQGYSVWFKPADLLSQGSKWGDHCTIGRYSELHLRPERSAFVVHRLDRAASGLILLAHTKALARSLSERFAQREVAKHYRVVAQGVAPPQLELTLEDPIEGKPARSHARCLASSPGGGAEGGRTLFEVRIETGRKHQIRRHLAGAGFPLVGDRLHGDNAEADLCLVAFRLELVCPVEGAPRVFELPEELLPPAFQAFEVGA